MRLVRLSLLMTVHGVTDYTADIAQVKIDGVWRAMSKVGRNRGENPDLETVS